MIIDCILLVVGMALLIKGADWFVDGSSKIAKALKIPSLIIGLTLVSMGTSAPELSVSLNAALSGSNDLSFGNVVGSNIFNTFFILGASALVIPLSIKSDMKKLDMPIMTFIYLVLALFVLVISPYELSRLESIVLLILFSSYMVLLFTRAKKQGNSVEQEKEEPITKKQIILSVLFCAIGLAAIIFGGDLVVDSAKNIASYLGMSEALIGLTIVAVGTSLPELVTSIMASIKKEDDIAIGNVIGSNIFNVLFILGISSTISPIVVSTTAMFDLIVLCISGFLVIGISLLGKNVKRWQGLVYLVLYVLYTAYIIYRDFN